VLRQPSEKQTSAIPQNLGQTTSHQVTSELSGRPKSFEIDILPRHKYTWLTHVYFSGGGSSSRTILRKGASFLVSSAASTKCSDPCSAG
jgi:hypothetical protein